MARLQLPPLQDWPLYISISRTDPFSNLAQRVDEALAIRIIHGDQFAPVTAIHDVINRASLLGSQLAGHARGVALAALYINIKN